MSGDGARCRSPWRQEHLVAQMGGLCCNGHALSRLSAWPTEYHHTYCMRCDGCAEVIDEETLAAAPGLHCPAGCGYDLCGVCADFAGPGNSLDGRPSSPDRCTSPRSFVKIEPDEKAWKKQLSLSEMRELDSVVTRVRREKASHSSTGSSSSSIGGSLGKFPSAFLTSAYTRSEKLDRVTDVGDEDGWVPEKHVKVDDAEYKKKKDDNSEWCDQHVAKMRKFLLDGELAPRAKFLEQLTGTEACASSVCWSRGRSPSGRPDASPRTVASPPKRQKSPHQAQPLGVPRPQPEEGCGILEPPNRWRRKLSTTELPLRGRRRPGMSASATTASLLRTRTQNVTALKMIERKAHSEFYNNFELGTAPLAGEESEGDEEGGERARSSARAMLRLLREQRGPSSSAAATSARAAATEDDADAIATPRPRSAVSVGRSCSRPGSAACAPNRAGTPLSARSPREVEGQSVRPPSASCTSSRPPLSARGAREVLVGKSSRPGSAACAPSRAIRPAAVQTAREESCAGAFRPSQASAECASVSRPVSAACARKPSPPADEAIRPTRPGSSAAPGRFSGACAPDISLLLTVPHAPLTARPASQGRKLVSKAGLPLTSAGPPSARIAVRSGSARRR